MDLRQSRKVRMRKYWSFEVVWLVACTTFALAFFVPAMFFGGVWYLGIPFAVTFTFMAVFLFSPMHSRQESKDENRNIN